MQVNNAFASLPEIAALVTGLRQARPLAELVAERRGAAVGRVRGLVERQLAAIFFEAHCPCVDRIPTVPLPRQTSMSEKALQLLTCAMLCHRATCLVLPCVLTLLVLTACVAEAWRCTSSRCSCGGRRATRCSSIGCRRA